MSEASRESEGLGLRVLGCLGFWGFSFLLFCFFFFFFFFFFLGGGFGVFLFFLGSFRVLSLGATRLRGRFLWARM